MVNHPFPSVTRARSRLKRTERTRNKTKKWWRRTGSRSLNKIRRRRPYATGTKTMTATVSLRDPRRDRHVNRELYFISPSLSLPLFVVVVVVERKAEEIKSKKKLGVHEDILNGRNVNRFTTPLNSKGGELINQNEYESWVERKKERNVGHYLSFLTSALCPVQRVTLFHLSI